MESRDLPKELLHYYPCYRQDSREEYHLTPAVEYPGDGQERARLRGLMAGGTLLVEYVHPGIAMWAVALQGIFPLRALI